MTIRADSGRFTRFRRQEHLARTGEKQNNIYRLEEGWACRYCLLPDGRRQIAALYLPGDYCEPQWLLSGHADLPVIALTDVVATEVSLAQIHTHPGEGVKRVLAAMLQMLERQTRWIVSLGRMTAIERISELLADLVIRLKTAPGSQTATVLIPLTQRDIADVVGLTPVHVNRVLHDLREQGLISQHGRSLLLNV